jgi:serine/threonine protein kinase
MKNFCPPSPTPATIGPYSVRGTIGTGAFSIVKLCHRSDDSEFYAVKVIARSLVLERNLLSRLEHEIDINRKLRHPGLVASTDLMRDSTNYYLFMEFCPNGELFQYIVSRIRLGEEEAQSLMLQLLDALRYIHSMGVVHRDLKPENILFDQHGHVKISDFGLARFAPPDELCHTPCGSPCYASPELLTGRPYDGRMSDVWSAGVILFAMVTGELPWTKRDQSQLFAQIRRGEYEVPSFLSGSCADLITRLMTVDLEKRITVENAMRHPWFEGVILKQTTVAPLRRISLHQFEACFDPRVQAIASPMRRTKSTAPMDVEKTVALLTRPTAPQIEPSPAPINLHHKGLPALPKIAVVPGYRKSSRLARPTARVGTGRGILML